MGLFKKVGSPEPVDALIVGLGNFGPEYSGTRHNVGFDVIKFLAEKYKIKLSTYKYQANFGIGRMQGRSVVLAKPMTYMNLSGRAVSSLAAKFGTKAQQILVIADDLDLEVGRVKVKAKGSSGGHNGHKSIIQSLGSDEYPRIKIGISKGARGVDHVLGRFNQDERTLIDRATETSAEAVTIWLDQGIEAAMNRINGA
ncbi:MAG: aminoacyl-tRNA hydrolase [Chthonomonadaceae bacterium]|nr:aminoacyl-tRNA hydrolase [Chthonomonadaceae bacterium]